MKTQRSRSRSAKFGKNGIPGFFVAGPWPPSIGSAMPWRWMKRRWAPMRPAIARGRMQTWSAKKR